MLRLVCDSNAVIAVYFYQSFAKQNWLGTIVLCLIFSVRLKLFAEVTSICFSRVATSLVYFRVIVVLGVSASDRRHCNPMVNLEKLDIPLYV